MIPAASESEGVGPGTIIDRRYLVQQEIGRGNMATVYLAKDELAAREVAIKVMSERLAGRHDRVQRFFNEHRYCTRVGRHENIVTTIADGRVGGEQGTPYLVMERVVGPSLDLLLAMKSKFEIDDARRIAVDIARGLEAVHAAGVVHRDIKPGNVIVAQLEEGGMEAAKLLDFGLATIILEARQGKRSPRLTLHEQIPGSAGYMAPEMVERVVPHPSADVFGLGMLMVELFAGRHPYEGLGRDEYLAEVTRKEWELPAYALDRIESASIRALVARCTRRAPGKRPPMAEVVFELEEAAVASAMPVVEASAVSAIRAVPALDKGGGGELKAAAKPATKRGGWLGVVVVVMLLGGALGLWWWLGIDEAEPEATRGREGLVIAAEAGVVGSSDTGGSSEGESSEGESSSEGSGGVEGTTGSETSAAVTAPRPRKPRRHKPDKGPRDDASDEGGVQPTPPEPAGVDEADCMLIRDSISSVRSRGKWSRVLFLAEANQGCFGSEEYRRIRVEALARSGQYDECIEAGGKVEQCEERQP